MLMLAAIRHCGIIGSFRHRRVMAHGAGASEHGNAREALSRDRETEQESNQYAPYNHILTNIAQEDGKRLCSKTFALKKSHRHPPP